MDFGVVSLDGLMGSDTTTTTTTTISSGLTSSIDPEAKQKWCGSGLLKQERSGSCTEDDWRSLKISKTSDDFSSSTKSIFLQSQPQQQMLSFSSPHKSDAKGSPNPTLPYLLYPSSAYTRNTGFVSGSLNGSMHGVLTAVRGPFTPSQWMELEHQALIYKYIISNVAVPPNLLIPIRKALDAAGFPSFSTMPLRPHTLGWGSFHLGFSGNTDPEPGRCRRTDGKKWRCSRDAVPDQKYCERHMNRGRHRSRKPVEGQNGHSVSGSVTAATTSNSNASALAAKLMPMGSSSSTSVVPGGASSNSLAAMQHQIKNVGTGAFNPPMSTNMSRGFLGRDGVGERMQDAVGLSMLSSSMNLRSKDDLTSIPKQQNLYEQSSRPEFGLVSSDSLLNPLPKNSLLMSTKTFGSSSTLTDQESNTQHPLRHFIDDWPKSQCDRSSTISWPEIDLQSERTQLSISIPAVSSDLMSSSSSPATNDKVSLSPLRLSSEFDPIQMGLGMGVLNEANQRQANWIPISWETSMGGPLGEVLHNTGNSNSLEKGKSSSSGLNLMSDGWDSSPSMVSSPTGVLQKSTFGSLSNSSAGSSPRADNNKTHEGAILCNDHISSTLVTTTSIPSL
ncbi:Glutamine-Leucine-Glutamine, QLQ [Dillenia turbinata]|uniref:Growth-regulating factor n=1 Tax=Dillenia turbinata TaxID=194707 RepID=A0AAN8VZD5_9MAGN